MDKIRVIIVDDHPLVLEGLRIILSGNKDILISGEARNAEELFALLQLSVPEIILLDLTLPTLSGIEITRL